VQRNHILECEKPASCRAALCVGILPNLNAPSEQVGADSEDSGNFFGGVMPLSRQAERQWFQRDTDSYG